MQIYKPNFCAECGVRVLRLRWHYWTSRKFCNDCARQLRKQRLVPWLIGSLALIGSGYVAGRIARPKPPPLTIIRRADSPLSSPEDPGPSKTAATVPNSPVTLEEDVYLCGARTKKGTPCSRRVHGPVRCWQHKGERAMLTQEKLRVQE